MNIKNEWLTSFNELISSVEHGDRRDAFLSAEECLALLRALLPIAEGLNATYSAYEKHCESCNWLYDLLSRREGKYVDDDVAKAWRRLVHEEYLQARAFARALGVQEPDTKYKPDAPSYTGKAS